MTRQENLNDLEDRSLELLEKYLANENLSIEKRASIAAKILDFTKNDSPSNEINLAELSSEWKKWIVENKLLKVPDRVLIQTMINNGIERQLAIVAVHGIQADNSSQQESNSVQFLKKLESIFAIKNQLAELSSNFGKIERRNRISREEFLEKYYATNTPVILTEMMNDWPAMSLWNPEYLKDKYGQIQVEVQTNRNSDIEYEINTYRHKTQIKFGEYIDLIVNGGETNDYYMVANNGNLDREEFKGLLEDIKLFPDLLDPTKIKQRAFFWFGPAGTITPLHHDPMNLMMAHVYGRKRWRLIAPEYTPLLYNYVGVFSKVDLENPDYHRYPLFKDVKIIETVLEPGEIIFVPVGWWHQVKGLDISIALSFTNFLFPNEYNFQNPQIRTETIHQEQIIKKN